MADSTKIMKRADPSTIQRKFMVGYQGWFTCPGDGEPVGPGHHGWLHWFNQPIPDGGRPNTDLWPDVSDYSPSELFPAPGLKFKNGEQAFLFSSRHPKTVQRHFHWMAQHSVDGAFLQRFLGQTDEGEGILRIRDEVGDRVREAAEKEERVFAIMYDISGVSPERILPLIQRDWPHLIHTRGVLDSPNYLREGGKPVIALWGFGFADAHHTPALIRSVTSFLRAATPNGAYIMAGAPAHWRTATSDADRDPAFLDVWLEEFDAISPWTVGRYATEEDVGNFARERWAGDVELLARQGQGGRGRKVDYVPVVLPGGSGFNLSEGKWSFNGIKRNGGHFLWKQLYEATQRLEGVKIVYGAMWDEYDEGTAFMPVVPKTRLLPQSEKYSFLALDEDGFDLPSDWYMRICGFAASALRGERGMEERLPVKELQDYWASRPIYESRASHSQAGPSGGGGGVGVELGEAREGTSTSGKAGESYEEWLLKEQKEKEKQKEENGEDEPPPPYSLEAEEGAGASASNGDTEGAEQRQTLPSPSSERTEAGPAPQPRFNTRPASVSVSSYPEAQAHVHNGGVASLTNAFASASLGASSSPPSVVSATRPPLHPSHPGNRRESSSSSSASSVSGSTPPLHPAHPRASTRPGGQSQSQQQQQQQSQSLASEQWPPPEWGLPVSSSESGGGGHGETDIPHMVYQQRPLKGGGASLGPRPSTSAAGRPPSTYAGYPGPSSPQSAYNTPPPNGGATLTSRPSMSSSYRPITPQVYPGPGAMQQSSAYNTPPNGGAALSSRPSMTSSYRPTTPQAYAEPPYHPSAAAPRPSSTQPQPYAGGSTYPGGGGYDHSSPYRPSSAQPPSPSSYGGNPGPQPYAAPPFPPPGSSSFPHSGSPYLPPPPGGFAPYPHQSSSSWSPYPGQSSYPHPYPSSSSSPPMPEGPAFPQFPQMGGGGGGYFNNSSSSYPQENQYQSSYYPGQQQQTYDGRPSPYPPYPQQHDPGPWFPNAGPPPIPPRPSPTYPAEASYSYSSAGGPSFPTSASSSSYYDLVDKVAGSRTRKTIEDGVETIAQTGSKLLKTVLR